MSIATVTVRPAPRTRSSAAIQSNAADRRERAALLRAVRSWLGLGLLALAVFPAARGYNTWIGWLPYWLTVAPLAILAIAEHTRLAGAFSALLASGRRRRLHARRPQARALAGAQRGNHRRARAA